MRWRRRTGDPECPKSRRTIGCGKVKPMPMYKLVRNRDFHEWTLVAPNEDEGLHIVNTTIAGQEGIGPFRFEPNNQHGPGPVEYCLVEISATSEGTSYVLVPEY
jgi:hypothetical protein